MQRAPAFVLLSLLVACGGGGRSAPIANQPGPAGAADPAVALEALARAVQTDDAAGFAALVHPVHGTTVWYTPGAGYAVFARVEPGAAPAKPSTIGVHQPAADNRAYWEEHLWPIVGKSAAAGLTHLDREPADPHAPIYGTCDETLPQDFRAYLLGGKDDAQLREFDLGGDGTVDPAKVVRDLTLFHTWELSAYLARHEGTWRVVHLLVNDPCSA